MESNFFSGSENLYKYLVSIGLLMVVFSIYYPQNERQILLISTVNIRAEQKAMAYEIDINQKYVNQIKDQLKDKKIDSLSHKKLLAQAREATDRIMYKQLKLDGKVAEVEVRESYITFYKWVVIFAIPVGLFLMFWGFFKWRIARKNEDSICELEKTLLELQIDREKASRDIENQV